MAKKKTINSVKFKLPEKEETTTISIRVPETLKRRLENFSKSNGYTSSEVLKSILEQFLDAQKS